MNDNKLPPVIVPFVMVHVGVFGIVASIFAIIRDDLLIVRIGAAALVFSVFLIVAGLLAIYRFRRRPNHELDAIAAQNALSIFILPSLSVISMFLQAFICLLGLFIFAPVLTVMIQLHVQKYSIEAAQSYCTLLKCREPRALKWIFIVLLTLINWGLFWMLFYRFAFGPSL